MARHLVILMLATLTGLVSASTAEAVHVGAQGLIPTAVPDAPNPSLGNACNNLHVACPMTQSLQCVTGPITSCFVISPCIGIDFSGTSPIIEANYGIYVEVGQNGGTTVYGGYANHCSSKIAPFQ